MESLSIKEIIKSKVGYKAHVKKIIDNFKKTINREIPNSQEENLKKLASLFLNDVKVNKPIVVSLDIGQGKSTLLMEFIKCIHEVDDTFSSVIVKRTLQEGREFCINVGLKNNQLLRDLVESSDNPIKKLEDIYYGEIRDYESYGFANGFPHEDVFIARLLRGFNYKDCRKYKDPTTQPKVVIGKLPDFYEYYSPALCKNCESTCGAKLSNWTIENHPTMVITHQRLFLSNDSTNIADSISGRKVLIIDEKLQTKDIGDVLVKQWEEIYQGIMTSNISDRNKGLFYRIDIHLKGLKFPESTMFKKKRIKKIRNRSMEAIQDIIEIPPYDPQLKFDASVYGVLMEDYKKINNLAAMEKFLNYGGTTSLSWHNFDAKQFSYIRYINLENYTRHFDKTIILDATSLRNGKLLDVDYQKSDVIFLNGLEETARGKINLYHSPQKTTKNALIINNNDTVVDDEDFDEDDEDDEDDDDEDFDEDNDREIKTHRDYHGDMEVYKSNLKLIALEIQDIITATSEKTLIICYRSIVDRFGAEFKFEDDLNKMLATLRIDPKLFSIKHFGAVTTGVNDFKDYKNIIFVGMLNKGSIYYKNKGLAIGNKNFSQVKLSEDIIDCIQQIGRICVRKGEVANVYMLFQDKLRLTEELSKHFALKKKIWMPKYFNGINNITKAKKRACWFLIIQVLSQMNQGDKMSFQELQILLKIKQDTIYRAIKHNMVKAFMDSNAISYDKGKRIFKAKKVKSAKG